MLWLLLYRLLSNKSLFTISYYRTSWLLYLWMCRLLSLLFSGNRAFRQRALSSGHLLLHRLMRLLSRLLYWLFSNKGFFTVSYDRTCWLLYLLLGGNRAFRQRVLGSGYLLLHRLLRLMCRLLHWLLSNKSLFTVSYDRTGRLLYLWLCRLLSLLLSGQRAFRQRALGSGHLLLH